MGLHVENLTTFAVAAGVMAQVGNPVCPLWYGYPKYWGPPDNPIPARGRSVGGWRGFRGWFSVSKAFGVGQRGCGWDGLRIPIRPQHDYQGYTKRKRRCLHGT